MAVLVYSVILILFYALHSWMASNSVKAFAEKRGLRDQSYRIVFNLIALLSSFIVIRYYFIADSPDLGSGSFWGIGLLIIGLMLIITALLNYDMIAFIGVKKEKAKEELVLTGLNKYVRHPLYLGVIVALLGWLILHPSWATMATLVITFVYVIIGIQLEEIKLVDQYGQAYIEYKKEVPKLWPRIF